jgi:Tfp pilus assembly protein PilF
VKICPMCGSDVLGAQPGAKCTSCGANLDETPQAATDATPEGRAAGSGVQPPKELDDSAPIMRSDDLEVVQAGHAFWTENRERDEEDTDPTGSFAKDAKAPSETAAEPAAQDAEKAPRPSTIFTAESTNADAPSLAELARRRKALLSDAAFADAAGSTSEIRHDHVTAPAATPASDKKQDDAEEPRSVEHSTTAEASKVTEESATPEAPRAMEAPRTVEVIRTINLTGTEKTTASNRTTDPDETQPAGIKTDPEIVAQAAQTTATTQAARAAGAPVVAKSPDIAFIDDNRLAIPGARWSSGDKVVISGRTYELRRKINKYPVTPREMLIGTGTFLVGLILAWMISAGGKDPTSAVFGVVREAESGKLLPGVTVALEENNRTVESDPSGLFFVNDLKGGIYTMVATDPIYGSTRKAVTVAGDATSVTIDLERPQPAEPPSQPQATRRPQRPASTASVEQEESAANKGSELIVEAPVSNARVFLDGKLLGVGNARYSDIEPGKHKVEVTHDGFQSWRQTIRFASGETMRIKADLQPVREPEPVQVSADEYAAQGRKFIEARNWKLALEQFEAALSQEQRPQFYAWRAEAFVGLKDLHHAEADFLQAVYLFRQSNQSSRLDGLLERAVLVVPASAPLWQARGDYLYSQRKLTDAEKCYRRALELGGDQVAILTAIGLTQYAGGSFDAAFQSWTQADESSGGVDPHLAGYLALVSARLQYRTSCRDAVRRLMSFPDVLTQFRAHPDWDKVQRLSGQG